jgi:putative DNA primase/helicase
MGLQVQSATLLSFFEKSGALARGTGFLARFLIAWPESTQGNRPFTEAPEHWPSLAAFNQCITTILNLPVPINENGSLTPQTLTLTPEAKAAWIAYHDAIEGELASGGELFDVRDVASKSADNAARLAALFHVFEGGLGAINADAFERASLIAAWHLNESRRFFGEIALPIEMADAARLDRWLIEYCKRERKNFVARRYAQRHGIIRDGARLDAAISELESLDRIQLRKVEKQLSIWINPTLMTDGGKL